MFVKKPNITFRNEKFDHAIKTLQIKEYIGCN